MKEPLKDNRCVFPPNVLPTIIVPLSLEYTACKMVDQEPSKEAMENHIKRLETNIDKIKNNALYKILKYFKLIHSCN